MSPSGRKVIGRAGVLATPTVCQVGRRLAAGELLAVDLAVAVHLDRQPLGERVHD